MIVRILNEGQYRMDNALLDDLNKIDNLIVDHVSRGDEAEFRKDLEKLISTVRELGDPLDPVDIVQSDVIIPPEDMTFKEAKRVFSGHGLIKD